ncbi:MAG: hypothetical protein Q9164_006429, partial [Protoblastenia rupestris]
LVLSSFWRNVNFQLWFSGQRPLYVSFSSQSRLYEDMKNIGIGYSALIKPKKCHGKRETVSFLRKYFTSSALIMTTIISLLLFASNKRQYSVSGDYYTALSKYRASVQIAVQFISSLLGFLQQSIVCQLYNYHTRLRIRSTPPTLDTIYVWNSISAARTAWGLRIKLVLATALFALGTLVPAALWAGAITPTLVVTQAREATSILVPQFMDAANIREWPSEINDSGPLLRSTKGLFSFSPGVKLLGSLLASAASATTVDGRVREHAKFDNTRYTYNGRSFGAGASVGLSDSAISDNPLALSYSYRENGLRTDVKCIHNSSAQFIIEDESLTNIYPVRGYLPNSGDSESYSEYYGHRSDAIVAIGITNNNASTERILGIAAGASYAALNATQCTFHFIPKIFNFELISNDQTSLYVSLLGDSFNSSIANYKSSVASNGSHALPDETAATLAGLANSVTAMVDDLLVAYSSAQLMIMNDMDYAFADVRIHAFRYGSGVYMYLSFAINIAIALLLLEEAFRTRGWRDLLYFDYMDPRSLIVGASMGGCAVAHAAEKAWTDREKALYKYDEKNIGNVRVTLHENHKAIVLDTSRSQQKELPGIVLGDDDD